MKNCPFYGHAYFAAMDPKRTLPFMLIATDGNQCGLITTSHAPCWMEVNHLAVEWSECPYVRDARVGGGG